MANSQCLSVLQKEGHNERPIAARLRNYMPNVCAYWATRYNNLT
jgi:hypothetical protein